MGPRTTELLQKPLKNRRILHNRPRIHGREIRPYRATYVAISLNFDLTGGDPAEYAHAPKTIPGG